MAGIARGLSHWLLVLTLERSAPAASDTGKFSGKGRTVQIETLMSEFRNVGELETWILEILRTRCGVDQRLHKQLENAWFARLESIRLGYTKDYSVVVKCRVFLTRHGPKRAERLARQQADLQEQWRELREAAGDE